MVDHMYDASPNKLWTTYMMLVLWDYNPIFLLCIFYDYMCLGTQILAMVAYGIVVAYGTR